MVVQTKNHPKKKGIKNQKQINLVLKHGIYSYELMIKVHLTNNCN
jgi:hypothetical protein